MCIYCGPKKNAHSVYMERKERNIYLTTHSTHFIYGYVASDIGKEPSDSSKGSFICTLP